MLITVNEIRQVMPTSGSFADTYCEPLNDALEEFDIDNPDRIAAFLANVAVESQELRKVEENMNYSIARLMVVWPTRFRTAAEAMPYARNPEKLANKVYANRLGNGDEASGDGWRYRGSGLIQLTGRDHHQACANHFQMPLADVGWWLRQPEGAARSAAWYWHSKALNQLADAIQFAMVVRRVVGDLRSLPERSIYWERAKSVFA